MRTFSHLREALFAIFVVVLCTLGTPTRTSAQEQTSVPTVVGRLATVEPSSRRVTIVPEGEIAMLEMFLNDEGRVERDGETLTLAQLVIEVGRRVTVHYRLADGRRLVDRIIVEPES